jgi:hypothetical protein
MSSKSLAASADTNGFIRAIGPEAELTAYVHPVSVSEMCGTSLADPAGTGVFTLSHAEVGAMQDGNPEIRADFRVVDGGACKPKTLVLHYTDFRRAVQELREPERPKKPSVRIKR